MALYILINMLYILVKCIECTDKMYNNSNRMYNGGPPKKPYGIKLVKRISDFDFGPLLRLFAGGICVFGDRKPVPAELQIGQIFSVWCLMMMCSFFFRPGFGPGRSSYGRKYAKKTSKKGDRARHWAPNSTTFGTRSDRSGIRWSVAFACGATCPAGSF